ncbi:MAG: transcriptional repressor [Thiobacillaceae bacterium]|nr:transcriptional repressor [Thiobacillaceae bacterium]MCX7673130.1 transcriptional repressor [Thiobacillaceae bacterium]MDW8323510.1 Fur family transcriptional regulator [Burkholderiales bacterium]
MQSGALTREEAADLLRRHGITPTHQRLEIAHVLFARKQHLSADQIMSMVNLRHCEASKATVYNTLKLFLEKGLIREVIVDPARVFYDSNTEPHHHFYNTQSGELIDIDAAGMQLMGLPRVPEGMVAERVDIVIRIRPQSPATA